MDVRHACKRLACKPKFWAWLLVGVIAVFTVSRALSQPASKSANGTPGEAEPLPATEKGPEDVTFGAYLSPQEDIEAAAREIRTKYAGAAGLRVAADARTGKLLVMAPAGVHKQLAAQYKPAGDVGAANGKAGPHVQKTLKLKNTQWRDFEAALASLAGRPLPVATQRDGQLATYTLTARSGSHVMMTVDRENSQITFDGPTDLVSGWIRVAMALDMGPKSTTDDSRVVPLRNSDAAATGAIRRAMSIVGQQVNETTVDGAAKMVSMRFQPREGARAGGAAAAQPDSATGQQQPPAPGANQPLPGADEEGAEGGLIGPVQIEFLEGLDVIVIRGHPRDVERVTEIINQIEQLATQTVPVIEIVYLKHTSSEAMATLVTTIYTQQLAARQGNVSVTPLVKPNALLLIGRRESVTTVIDLITKLDQSVPAETQFQVFPLRHTSANEIEATVREYLGVPTTGAGAAAAAAPGVGLSPRGLVIGDYRTNSLIVRASPRDLEEIDLLIKRIDVPTSAAVNEMRVFTLRNSLAEELAPVLQSAITGQTQQVRGGQQQQPGGFQQFQQQQQQQQQGQQQRGQQQQQARSTMLQFYTLDAQGRRTLRSGILTDVRITADTVGNSLIVSAPAESMDLIAALIAQLDQIPTSSAQIKVFTIENGDAQSLMNMLQQLFGLQQTGAGGARTQAGVFQQFFVPDGDGNPLVSLRFSVDTRTNSIIASGSAGDLAVVEAILLRLDESDVRGRRSIVYRLKNAPAIDIANSINQLLTSQRQIQQQFQQQLLVSPFEQIEREVVVVPEIVTNSLIISATPRFFEEIRTMIEELDRRPPMVAIQVLIAEVTLSNTDEFGVELGLQDSVLFDRSLLGDIQTITRTTTFGDPPTTVQEQQIVTATNTPGFLFNNLPLGNSGSTQAISRSNVVGTQGLSHFAVGRQNNELGFGGLVLSASSESVSFLLRALSESRRLDVLARPQVTTLENQPAFVQVGQQVPLVNNVTFTQFGQTNTVTPTNVGLILLVTPRVTSDGLVVMDIHAERSEVGPEAEGFPISITATGEVFRQPRINRTVAETTVSALNGQTLVLGGLITKTKNETHRRVPLLSDIPILGHLFRYDNVQGRRTELLIIMTPRVLRTKEDADILKQVESARMSWCLADVIKIHGESGLRGRNAEWTDAETTVIYPNVPHEMIEPLVPGSAEEILTPPATSPGMTPRTGPPTAPPPALSPPGPTRLPPPTSPPPPAATPMRIPLDNSDAPPTLPDDGSGARARRPAGPAVNGPTLAPVHSGAALANPPAASTPSQPRSDNQVSPARGSFYANGDGQPQTGSVQQAMFQPPQGSNQQAVFRD